MGNKKHLNKNEIISFAESHGWKLADSINANDIPQEYVRKEKLLKWLNTAKAYRFITDQVLFEPGTDISTDTTGLVILTINRKNLAVYHIWGE